MNRRSSSLAALWFAAFVMAACSSGNSPVDAAPGSGAPPGGTNAATGTGGVTDGGATGGHHGRGGTGGSSTGGTTGVAGFAGGFGFNIAGFTGFNVGGFNGFGTGGVVACAGPGEGCDTLLCCGSLHCCSSSVTRTCASTCATTPTTPAGF
jgi:hypothetical protein